MLSALWLGNSRGTKEYWIPFMKLPVKTIVLEDFNNNHAALPGQIVVDSSQAMEAIQNKKIFFIGVENWDKIRKEVGSSLSESVAIGSVKPPKGILWKEAAPENRYETLVKMLPSLEPSTLYCMGDRVEASVADETFIPFLERMGSIESR